MEFRVRPGNIRNAVKVLSQLEQATPVNMILHGTAVHMTAQQAGLELSLAVPCVGPLEPGDLGSVFLKHLEAIAGSVGVDGEIKFEVGPSQLSVSYGKMRWKINLMEPAPHTAQAYSPEDLVANPMGALIKDELTLLTKFTDPAQPYLAYILLEADDAVATDGLRVLYLKHVFGLKKSLIMSTPQAEAVARLVDALSPKRLEFYSVPLGLIVKGSYGEVFAPLSGVEDEAREYLVNARKLLDGKGFVSMGAVKVSELSDSVGQAGSILVEHNVVDLTFMQGKLVATGSNTYGEEAQSEMAGSFTKEGKLLIDAALLRRALSAINEPRMDVSIAEGDFPSIRFNGQKATYLQMAAMKADLAPKKKAKAKKEKEEDEEENDD